MGTIVVNVGLENAEDRAAFKRGLCDEASIRRTEVEGVVDTDAVSLALPQNVVERLGLDTRGTAVVTYADGRKDERPVVGPLTVYVVGRSMNLDAIVLPPFSEVLVGQIVLEFLDLVADSRNRTLQPRMPDYPLLDMKSLSRQAPLPGTRTLRPDGDRPVLRGFDTAVADVGDQLHLCHPLLSF